MSKIIDVPYWHPAYRRITSERFNRLSPLDRVAGYVRVERTVCRVAVPAAPGKVTIELVYPLASPLTRKRIGMTRREADLFRESVRLAICRQFGLDPRGGRLRFDPRKGDHVPFPASVLKLELP